MIKIEKNEVGIQKLERKLVKKEKDTDKRNDPKKRKRKNNRQIITNKIALNQSKR